MRFLVAQLVHISGRILLCFVFLVLLFTDSSAFSTPRAFAASHCPFRSPPFDSSPQRDQTQGNAPFPVPSSWTHHWPSVEEGPGVSPPPLSPDWGDDATVGHSPSVECRAQPHGTGLSDWPAPQMVRTSRTPSASGMIPISVQPGFPSIKNTHAILVVNPPPTTRFTDCPTGSLDMALSPVTIPVAVPIKPYQLTYGALPLTWTPTVSPAGKKACTLHSTVGNLPILISFLGQSNSQVATSTGSATLDFMGSEFESSAVPTCDWLTARNNCFLNTPGPQPTVVRWHTSGFVETINGLNVHCLPCDPGPLTFYVDAASLFAKTLSIPAILEPMEAYIHTTLLTHLPSIDTIAVIQEPPNEVRVRDGSGNITGRLPNDQIAMSIPGSTYVPGARNVGAAVIILNQPPVSYSIEVIGKPGASYTLVSSYARFSRNGLSPTVTAVKEQGVLGPSGRSGRETYYGNW